MSKADRYVKCSRGDIKLEQRRQRGVKPPIKEKRKMALASRVEHENPLIARAAETVSDTYFIESWGIEGGMAALRNKIEWYQKLLAQTEAFAATLTPEEYASIAVMPTRETAEGRAGREDA